MCGIARGILLRWVRTAESAGSRFGRRPILLHHQTVMVRSAVLRICGRCVASLGEAWGPDADFRASSFETLAKASSSG